MIQKTIKITQSDLLKSKFYIMRVGIIGCGNISETYFNSQKIFNNFKIISCADINNNISKKSAKKFNIKSESVEEILSNKEVDLTLNLTVPSAHKKIILDSLNSGKSCFSEKPLAMNFKEGLEIAKIANKNKLYVGCAPDTFLVPQVKKQKTNR